MSAQEPDPGSTTGPADPPHPGQGDRTARARSFGALAEVYDRTRPGYPPDAVEWLTGSGPLSVVELGAGTGKLTELLVRAGHDVLATDPDAAMLARLEERVPAARTAVAAAERIPAPTRSVDVVVCAQSFHWFDHDVALEEIARVLRPGGRIAVVWNRRDESVPWIRKLSRIVGAEPELAPEIRPLQETEHFGWVEEERFRNWATHTRVSLLDLVRTLSPIAALGAAERDDVLRQVGLLYDDYGRGHDGMQLSYVAECFRATVHHRAPAPPVAKTTQATVDPSGTQPTPGHPAPPPRPPEDPGTTLIDFR